ncbi:hypothetical protein ACLB2K_038417 [Fragaria x ananassa]
MAEPFLKSFLGFDKVLGTEIATYNGIPTGFVCSSGLLIGQHKADALHKAHGTKAQPDIGIGNRHSDIGLIAMCKLLPLSLAYYSLWALGVHVTVKGTPPTLAKHPMDRKNSGQIFVMNHRTVFDSFFLYLALGCLITAPTYSSSRIIEFISPFKTVRISRDRKQDTPMIKKLLQEGDNIAICPEGTTCKEPYVLRFSALFAELSDQLVPVALVDHQSMFHGTTARGWKAMDRFFFTMNPRPSYEVTFLNKLAPDQTCNATSGKNSFEVANYVQRVIAATLSYECTSFTRTSIGLLLGLMEMWFETLNNLFCLSV